jgi:hypothetical protein
VQFHPESVSTQFGDQLIRNFLQLARDHIAAQPYPCPSPGLAVSARPSSLTAALAAAAAAAAAATTTTTPSAFALPRPAAATAAAAAAAAENDRDRAQAEGAGMALKWLRLSHTATDAGGSEALFWCVSPLPRPTPCTRTGTCTLALPAARGTLESTPIATGQHSALQHSTDHKRRAWRRRPIHPIETPQTLCCSLRRWHRGGVPDAAWWE